MQYCVEYRVDGSSKKSPRWLLVQNRSEEALHSLKLLRQGRYTDEEIDEEFSEIQHSLSVTVEKGSAKELFVGSTYSNNLLTLECHGHGPWLSLPSSASVNFNLAALAYQSLLCSLGNLRRTLITIGVNIFLQLTGQNFSSVYGTIFIQSIGTINPFTMNTINIAVNIVTVLISQLMTDKVGRK